MAQYEYPDLGSRDEFDLKLGQLNDALAVNSSTGPVSSAGLGSILGLAAQITQIPLEFFEAVLELEADYPRRASYSSAMPRQGDEHRRLPDPRYPHPSAYSAQKGRKYADLAGVNAGTQIYIGVTQMSFEFWDDVKRALLAAGVKREYLPLAWWQAPLLVQVIAPLVYFKIYGNKYPAKARVNPSTVYMLHQQGPGWVQSGMRALAGQQSVKTSTILRAARRSSGYF